MGNQTIALIGVASALVSALMALASWYYNRELSRATISVVKVEIHHRRVKKDKLRLDVLWTFKNVGNETLKITHDRFGVIDFERRRFEEIPERPMLNPVHRGGSFGILLPFTTMDIDPQTRDEDIPDILPKIGKHALILSLKYKGTSLFSWRDASLKHFVRLEGHNGVYQLSEDEYREIEEHLPQEFRVSQ